MRHVLTNEKITIKFLFPKIWDVGGIPIAAGGGGRCLNGGGVDFLRGGNQPWMTPGYKIVKTH